MKVIFKIIAVVLWMILSLLELVVRAIEKVGNIIAGFIYVILIVFALMAIISQQWVSLGIFGVCAFIVLGIQFGASMIEALIEVARSFCTI